MEKPTIRGNATVFDAHNSKNALTPAARLLMCLPMYVAGAKDIQGTTVPNFLLENELM